MKKQENHTLKRVQYRINLVFSTLILIVAAVSFYVTMSNMNAVLDAVVTGKYLSVQLLPAYICLFSIIAETLLMNGRVSLRHVIDYDESGLSKVYANYDKLKPEQRAEIERQKLMDEERILNSNQIRKMTKKGPKNPDEEMKKMIGLSEVKTEMKKFVARMEFEKSRKNYKNSEFTTHMCFIGPPGTGKTTCARIMTSFLYKYKYIRENKCIEVDGNFLKGNALGETSKKVNRLVLQSLGGVLFIDEAYALLEGADGSGKEAIATLVKAMEDRRGEFVLILAGYQDEMKSLINSNPGLFSRIKYYFNFGNYSVDELSEIFKFMAKEQGFSISPSAMQQFKIKIKNQMPQRNFGNARTVRNILEKAIDKHAFNLMEGSLEETAKNRIEDIDIDLYTTEEEIFG